jgi:probable HAF family extracellular repeat protein
MFRAIALVVLLLLLAVRLVAVAAQGTFTTIDVPGATSTAALAINARGDIVGDYTTADGVVHGFLLRKGEFTTIDVPAATDTRAFGINARGDIVGGVRQCRRSGPWFSVDRKRVHHD